MTQSSKNNLRDKIAYWFFMLMGFAGVTYQMYEFMTGHITFTPGEVAVTAFFSVFIFKPRILVNLFELIKNIKFNNK